MKHDHSKLEALRTPPDAPPKVVVAWSGGKDSAYLLLRARSLGMTPVGMAIDTGFLSSAAVSNILSVPQQLRISLHVVNARQPFARLYDHWMYLESLDMCAQCHALIDGILRKHATKHYPGLPIWSGVRDAELRVFGSDALAYRHKTGFLTPLDDRPWDDPDTALEKAGVRMERSPLKTNCRMIYNVLHASRGNPYAPYLTWRRRLVVRLAMIFGRSKIARIAEENRRAVERSYEGDRG